MRKSISRFPSSMRPVIGRSISSKIPSSTFPSSTFQYDDASPPLQSNGRGRGQQPTTSEPIKEEMIGTDIINILSGTSRGKPIPSAQLQNVQNRHIRPPPPPPPRNPNLNVNVNVNVNKSNEPREEKVRKAVEILSRGVETGNVGENARENNTRGNVGRGRGRGRERVLSRGNRERDGEEDEDEDEEVDTDDEIDTEDDEDLFIGDDAEGEKMAQKLGPEVMDKLVEGFDEAFERVLPDPEDDEYEDALETNLMLECDPEYFMEEFGTNPDIDEKPIIPLRDALEKMKPFLMAYEGIQSHEEWEAVIEETMKSVPLMQKIVDEYGGPDRATAKQQQAELERVAKTLPTSAPDSVRRFTERAVLSLQSNPGWGFDKKCQYMDKLVMEVSQQYK